MIEVIVLEETGYQEALIGLSLSYNQPTEKMVDVSWKLAALGGSHAKFLESMVVWVDIRAPRYWWQEFDTYRVGVTKQSESTIHTIKKRPLTQDDFVEPIDPAILEAVNRIIEAGDLRAIKRNLPEGFMQRRIVCMNYKNLAHINHQRKNHKLIEWRVFLDEALGQIDFPEFVLDYGSGA